MTCLEIAQFTKEIIISVVSIGTFILALISLSTWKNQFKSKVKFESAKSIMLATYKVRSGFDTVRYFYISPIEFYDASKKHYKAKVDNGETPTRLEQTKAVYQSRMETLYDAFSELEAKSVEAEVYFSDEILDLIKELKSIRSTLDQQIRLRIEETEKGKSDLDRAGMKYRDEVLYKIPESTENPFDKKIDDAILAIKKYLMPYLSLEK